MSANLTASLTTLAEAHDDARRGRGRCVALQVSIARPWHCNCAPRAPRLCVCSWQAVRATLDLCAVGDAGAEARHAPLRAPICVVGTTLET